MNYIISNRTLNISLAIGVSIYCVASYIRQSSTQNKYEVDSKTQIFKNTIKRSKVRIQETQKEIEQANQEKQDLLLFLNLTTYLKKSWNEAIEDLSQSLPSEKSVKSPGFNINEYLQRKLKDIAIAFLTELYKNLVIENKPEVEEHLRKITQEIQNPRSAEKLLETSTSLHEVITKVNDTCRLLGVSNTVKVQQYIDYIISELLPIIEDSELQITKDKKSIDGALKILASEGHRKIDELADLKYKALKGKEENLSQLSQNFEELKKIVAYGELELKHMREIHGQEPILIDCYKKGKYFAYCINGKNIPLFIYRNSYDIEGNYTGHYIIPGVKTSKHQYFMPLLKKKLSELGDKKATLVVEVLQNKSFLFKSCSNIFDFCGYIGLGKLFNSDFSQVISKFFANSYHSKFIRNLCTTEEALVSNSYYRGQDIKIGGVNCHSSIGIVSKIKSTSDIASPLRHPKQILSNSTTQQSPGKKTKGETLSSISITKAQQILDNFRDDKLSADDLLTSDFWGNLLINRDDWEECNSTVELTGLEVPAVY